MKFRKAWGTFFLMIFLPVIIFLMPILFLHADNTNCDPAGGKICPTTNTTDINSFIKSVLEGVIKIGMPVVALAIIYCGFLFVAARGKPEAITKAKSALLYTLIGAALLLGSWALAQVISETVKTLGS